MIKNINCPNIRDVIRNNFLDMGDENDEKDTEGSVAEEVGEEEVDEEVVESAE